jgi:hypothetical protein
MFNCPYSRLFEGEAAVFLCHLDEVCEMQEIAVCCFLTLMLLFIKR